jgi:hypothetical protein
MPELTRHPAGRTETFVSQSSDSILLYPNHQIQFSGKESSRAEGRQMVLAVASSGRSRFARVRAKTIMQGASHCDFRYRRQKD